MTGSFYLGVENVFRSEIGSSHVADVLPLSCALLKG